MTEDEIFAAGYALGADWPPLTDEVVAKLGVILAPLNGQDQQQPEPTEGRDAA